MWRANSLEKTLMLGKIEGRRRLGQQRMRWLDGILSSMVMSLSKFQEMVKDGEAVHEVTNSWTRLRDWTMTSKENKWLGLKKPKLTDGSGERIFIGKIWEGCCIFALPLIGWWWNNRVVLQESQSSANQSPPSLGSTFLCSAWSYHPPPGGALVTVEELRDIYQMVMYILWGGTRTLTHGCTIICKLPFHCFWVPSFL